MMRSILMGLDGSAYSASAMELGIRWALRHNALLVGLGIVDEPTICKPEPVPLGAAEFKEHRDKALLANAYHKAHQFLDQFAARCKKAGANCKLVEAVGLPHELIALEAQRFDLILLGQETYFQFETRAGADHTLTRMLKNSPRPVVTVPEKLPEGKSVVIAYDGSLQAARTLQALLGLGLAGTQEVHVISVHSDRGEAAIWADRAAEFLRLHEVTAHVHPLESSSPAQVIQEQAKQLGAELVVMGAFGRPTLREFFFGSVTQTMLRESRTPLFLYH